jgi:hypothetical protein
MAAVRYSGHMLRTRQQAAWQSAVLLLVLVPLLAWRFTTHRFGIAFALATLTFMTFALAYQASRFLAAQERVHSEPTPEMSFVFRFVSTMPLAFGGVLFILLTSID